MDQKLSVSPECTVTGVTVIGEACIHLFMDIDDRDQLLIVFYLCVHDTEVKFCPQIHQPGTPDPLR